MNKRKQSNIMATAPPNCARRNNMNPAKPQPQISNHNMNQPRKGLSKGGFRVNRTAHKFDPNMNNPQSQSQSSQQATQKNKTSKLPKQNTQSQAQPPNKDMNRQSQPKSFSNDSKPAPMQSSLRRSGEFRVNRTAHKFDPNNVDMSMKPPPVMPKDEPSRRGYIQLEAPRSMNPSTLSTDHHLRVILALVVVVDYHRGHVDLNVQERLLRVYFDQSDMQSMPSASASNIIDRPKTIAPQTRIQSKPTPVSQSKQIKIHSKPKPQPQPQTQMKKPLKIQSNNMEKNRRNNKPKQLTSA